jgi:hypothetical protein
LLPPFSGRRKDGGMEKIKDSEQKQISKFVGIGPKPLDLVKVLQHPP